MKFDILLYGNNILTVQCLLQCVLHVKKKLNCSSAHIKRIPADAEHLRMHSKFIHMLSDSKSCLRKKYEVNPL
jgi:hypothetical protein